MTISVSYRWLIMIESPLFVFFFESESNAFQNFIQQECTWSWWRKDRPLPMTERFKMRKLKLGRIQISATEQEVKTIIQQRYPNANPEKTIISFRPTPPGSTWKNAFCRLTVNQKNQYFQEDTSVQCPFDIGTWSGAVPEDIAVAATRETFSNYKADSNLIGFRNFSRNRGDWVH